MSYPYFPAIMSYSKIKFELDIDCIKIIESNLQLIKKDRESLSKVENNECIHDFFDGHQRARSPGTFSKKLGLFFNLFPDGFINNFINAFFLFFRQKVNFFV